MFFFLSLAMNSIKSMSIELAPLVRLLPQIASPDQIS